MLSEQSQNEYEVERVRRVAALQQFPRARFYPVAGPSGERDRGAEGEGRAVGAVEEVVKDDAVAESPVVIDLTWIDDTVIELD